LCAGTAPIARPANEGDGTTQNDFENFPRLPHFIIERTPMLIFIGILGVIWIGGLLLTQ